MPNRCVAGNSAPSYDIGVWVSWTVGEGIALTESLAELAPGVDAVESCTILITVANAAVAPVHNFMPAIRAEGGVRRLAAGSQ